MPANLPGQIVYSSSGLLVRHVPAPRAAPGQNTVITFPDMLHPGLATGVGFGEPSLAKRQISQVVVLPRRADWFQLPEFLAAMAALRRHLGPATPVVTYGFSMGGYGAILAARALDARLALALAPQFSLDPRVVPGDLRFAPQAREIGPFLWDVAAEMDPARRYLVLHDPIHRLDDLNARLFARAGAGLLPIHGARHHIIPALVQAGAIETLFEVLRGAAEPMVLRNRYRAGRAENRPWIKRVGKACAARGNAVALQKLSLLAEAQGLHRLAETWRVALAKGLKRRRPA